MILLPPLACAPSAVRLPLCDASAERVGAILLSDDSSEREFAWSELLCEDPLLLVWVAAHHSNVGQSEPEKIASLAQWVAPKALTLLDWSELANDALPTTTELGSWRNIVSRGLTSGHERRGDESTTPAIDADFMQFTLAATLHAIRSAELSLPNNVIGSWLARCEKQHAADLPEPEVDDDSLPPDIKRALRQWRARRHIAPDMLPRLTDKLRRLRDLEVDHEQTLRREKLSAMRELAYGASHEINNPLANISTRAQTLLKEEPDPERRRMLATIHLQAMRAHEMIANLMHFAKPPRLDRQPFALTECVATVVDELAEWSAQQGTEVNTAIPKERLLIEADREQIMIALRALIRNSLEALATGGQVHVELTTSPADGDAAHTRPHAVVRIRDNGPGITPEVMPHIFDPFYSGREAGRGLGFGLAWSWRIIDRHGGRIEVESEAGHGAEFRVVLEQHIDHAVDDTLTSPQIITPKS